MPRLWNETIDAHRRDVREAILAAAWQLVREQGLLSVTMSQIAVSTGIGRATLYKYFPNVEAVLLAHHRSHVEGHLARFAEISTGPGEPTERLQAALTAYAMICHHRERHGSRELFALLHRDEQVAGAERQVRQVFTDLLAEARAAGGVRDDVAPAELAGYCLHALTAAGMARSEAAVRRLVTVTLAGLRPHPASGS